MPYIGVNTLNSSFQGVKEIPQLRLLQHNITNE